MHKNDPKYTICHNAKKFCCEDISLIENYAAMMADTTQVWCCHHRREIDEHKSKKQLISEGRYYNVPASDLIFLTKSEHSSLHHKGVPKPKSEETKKNISKARKLGHWYTNGIKTVFCKECPEGFKAGFFKRKLH